MLVSMGSPILLDGDGCTCKCNFFDSNYIDPELTDTASAAASLFHVRFGQQLQCHNCHLEQRPTGMIPFYGLSCSLELTNLSRIFTQKEVELARARIPPTDSRVLRGLFKWKDIKKWHTTWHVYLCKHLSERSISVGQMLTRKLKSLCISHSQPNSARPEDLVRIMSPSTHINLSNPNSDLLGQVIQCQRSNACLFCC